MLIPIIVYHISKCYSSFPPPQQIAETYAFLPREAVTRFLMSCADCQKRMHLSMTTESNNNNDSLGPVTSGENHVTSGESHVLPADDHVTSSECGLITDAPPIIDFSMPITTTYLNHWKKKESLAAGGRSNSAGPQLDDSYLYHADNEVSHLGNV